MTRTVTYADGTKKTETFKSYYPMIPKTIEVGPTTTTTTGPGPTTTTTDRLGVTAGRHGAGHRVLGFRPGNGSTPTRRVAARHPRPRQKARRSGRMARPREATGTVR